jgi:hypothetical protein
MKLLEKNIPELRKLMLSTVQYATVAAEDVLQSMPERYRKLPEDWFFGQKTESMSSADLWAAAPYHQSDYKPEEKTKITSRGLHVRSMARWSAASSIITMMFPSDMRLCWKLADILSSRILRPCGGGTAKSFITSTAACLIFRSIGNVINGNSGCMNRQASYRGTT